MVHTQTLQASRRSVRRAFTIVELLVTITVIGILAGFLVAGMRGAMGSSRKIQELADLRGVSVAWLLRNGDGTGSDSRALIGYNEMHLAPAPGCPSCVNPPNYTVDCRLQSTYTRQLLKYMDNNPGPLCGYLGVDRSNMDALKVTDISGAGQLPSCMKELPGLRGSALTLLPAFGCNAFYMGGWSTVSSQCIPFSSTAQWTGPQGEPRQGDLITSLLRTVKYPDRLIAFCSSTHRQPGTYKLEDGGESSAIGSFWVSPPALGQTEIWNTGMQNLQGIQASSTQPSGDLLAVQSDGAPPGSNSAIQVTKKQSVPLFRHNRQAAIMHVDGSVTTAGAAELMDMRRWIDNATSSTFRHSGVAPP